MEKKEKITTTKIVKVIMYELPKLSYQALKKEYNNASTKGKIASATTALGLTAAFGGIAADKIYTKHLTTPTVVEYIDTRNELSQLRNSTNTTQREAMKMIENTKMYNQQDLEEIVRPWTQAIQEKQEEIEKIKQHPEVDRYRNSSNLPMNLSISGVILAAASLMLYTPTKKEPKK